ncbi:hypothetical protein [Methylobacterium sp. Leaf88]|uniref:hypothetical protein n=1 Tax=Methylobacterium sp. Leaf88 TaxID=1736244 RepID=UPI0006FF2D3A|nr:hypothetical protein [Methylobacterium sp. Leaf88]KQO76428.1 hypothetical protein ASF20_13860 [Methylobacterium sp. Leaf88]
MMKRFHAALAAALFLSGAAPALADFQFTAGGQTYTQGATVVGGKSRTHFILYDNAGNPVLTSGNPGFFSITGAVPLPTGAATAAKQPAFGTAGAPSPDVTSIQGVANGTPIPTVGSQPSNIATGQFSCGTTAAQAVAARTGRRNVLLIQEGTTLVRIGASGVTPSTGAPLPGTAYSSMTIDGSAAVFCVTGSGTQTISYVETY